MNRAHLESLTRQWRRHHSVRHAAFSLAAAGLISSLLVPWSAAAAGAAGMVAGTGFWFVLRRRILAVTPQTLVEHLNRLDPRLEESAGLWLRPPDGLSLVERLQLNRLNSAWQTGNVPRRGEPRSRGLLPAGFALALSILVLVGVVVSTSIPSALSTADLPPADPTNTKPPAFLSAKLEIHPPAYLGRSSRQLDDLSADVEEGSTVVWRFTTSSNVVALELAGTGTHGSVGAQPLGNGRFQAQEVVLENRVYQIALQPIDGSQTVLPTLHVIRVVRDQAPRLAWRFPTLPRTSIAPSQALPPLPVEVLAEDDHGIAEVRLVLTVAKGSGEGMKFRDQSEVLKGSIDPGTSNLLYGRSLDLTALGLEPGDELYMHAIAIDAKSPIPNESRTETRWVTLIGPTTLSGDPAVMLSGVKRIPQYFRSQRQLILDTEQLLTERQSLSEAQFRARSQNIGIDQKLLRLRYGQFLGEEFEPDAAGAPKEAMAMEWAASIRNPSGQDAERTAAIGRAIEATHAHLPEPAPTGRTLTAQEMLAPLTHNHDSAEAATLFDEPLKASLRAVLAAMWEAEGFLRTAQPDAALPAEHRALETLKALQQADRLSVARVGFESPPLKVDERRLRGELDPIPTVASGTSPRPRSDADADALRRVIAALTGETPSTIPEGVVAQVDDRLLRAAQSQPERFLPALELWRSRRELQGSVSLETLRFALWALVPPTEESPRRPQEFDPELESRYMEALSPSPSRQP